MMADFTTVFANQPYQVYKDRASTIPAIPYHPLIFRISLMFYSLLACTLFGHQTAMADTFTSHQPFHAQLHRSDKNPRRNPASLLSLVMADHDSQQLLVIHPDHADDLAFNYLWLQQHQEDYRKKNGGSALGTLVRKGLKSFYRTHYGSTGSDSYGDDFGESLNNIDYRLRLSGDKVRFGIEYEF